MKSYMIIVAVLLFTATGYTYDVYDAIAEVESGTDDNAVNVRENAVGRYQITPIYVRDVNRISGKNFSLEDRKDPVLALEMVRIYTTHYGRIYAQRTGLPVTDEVIARIHNGGGWRGATKESTANYGQRVVNLVKCSAKTVANK